MASLIFHGRFTAGQQKLQHKNIDIYNNNTRDNDNKDIDNNNVITTWTNTTKTVAATTTIKTIGKW